MTLNPKITNAVAQAMIQALADAADAGTAAVIEIYDGAQPTDADTAIGAQTKLVTLTCSATIGSVSDGNPGGLLTFSAITSGSAIATGTAAWFRMLTQAGGTVIMDGTVGTGTHDIVFNTVAFTTSSTIAISAMTAKQPE